MLASWEKDVAQNSSAAGADLQQAVQVATVMEHAPAAYRDLLKLIPLENRKYYQASRTYVREWGLAQRTFDDPGRHTTPDTSAPMDIGQVKGTRGKGKKGKKGKGKEKGKKREETRGQMIPVLLASVGGKWRHKKAQCPKQKKDQRSNPPSCNSPRSCNSDSNPFIWRERRLVLIFAVSVSSGRNARILVDSGADAHVWPTNFASATPLGPAKGGMLYDAQGRMIEAHGTRSVSMRLGPEG